ncbi:hypothetical protein GGI12_004107 [Dipsacomyces acuminosporus]|nr:hypothetical protein GGI12_004107 [Dipsacomyces acuminosporus]
MPVACHSSGTTEVTAEDGSSAKQAQTAPTWIGWLQWDVLLEQLQQSGYLDEIIDSVSIPHEAPTLEYQLVELFVKCIYEMEQQEVVERSLIHKELAASNQDMPDEALRYLTGWNDGKSEYSENECVVVAIQMVYALIQLNKYIEYAEYLSQSDELKQAVLDLSELLDSTVKSLENGDEDGGNGDDDHECRIDSEDHYTGLLCVFRIMRLLWTQKIEGKESPICDYSAYRLLFLVCWREGEWFEPIEVKSVISHFEHWAQIAVDIHLQLQLSAWKEHCSGSGRSHELEKNYSKLATGTWWRVLEVTQEGTKEQRLYVKIVAKKRLLTLVESTNLYTKSGQTTPFDALQSAKDIVDDYLSNSV